MKKLIQVLAIALMLGLAGVQVQSCGISGEGLELLMFPGYITGLPTFLLTYIPLKFIKKMRALKEKLKHKKKIGQLTKKLKQDWKDRPTAEQVSRELEVIKTKLKGPRRVYDSRHAIWKKFHSDEEKLWNAWWFYVRDDYKKQLTMMHDFAKAIEKKWGERS